MEPELIISNIILQMREYQKQNGIIKKCVDNTQFIVDIINQNGGNAVAKPYIVLSNKDDVSYVIKGHLALYFPDDDVMIEPSYEIWNLENPVYFESIIDYTSRVSFPNEEIKKEVTKDTIQTFVKFVELAKSINRGKLTITDKNYYNNQADFIETYLIKSGYYFDINMRSTH